MNPSEVTHVFDRFWRADPSRKRTIGGTGLGLAISLEDAAQHDGWLDVWSSPGEGSNFRLTLPRTPGEPIESSPIPLAPNDAPRDVEGRPVGSELMGSQRNDAEARSAADEARERRSWRRGDSRRHDGRDRTREGTVKT
jgi:two-component system sensor histidine kinase MtrB